MRFEKPVDLAVGSYVVSYHAPNGRYAADTGVFRRWNGMSNGVLSAPGRYNGVYTYGSSSSFPRSSWQGSNYYVDVLFAPKGEAVVPPVAQPTPTGASATQRPAPSPTPIPTTAAPSPTPTRTQTSAPPPPPSTGGFPDASNTGVPAGVSLKSSGSLTISTAGAVVEGLNISGTVNINASNVTFRNSKVAGRGFALIRIKDGVSGVKIENVEVNGSGQSGEGNSMGIMGPATVLRSDIRGVENGVTPMSNSVIKGNYIHDLSAPGSPHYDGIQIDGGQRNILIEGNFIDMAEHGQTATVMIDNYFGSINDIRVNANRLIGGGYTVYSDGQFNGGTISGVQFTNNRLGKGQWGYASIVRNSPVWTNNVDDNHGGAVR